MIPLPNTVRIVAELRERLKAEYGLDDDDEALADTIEGETDLGEQLARLARAALRSEYMAKGIGELIKDTQLRKTRLEHRAEKLRAVINWALSESGTKKISAPDMTLSLSIGKAPIVIDDAAPIPERFLRVKSEPNKIAIRAALDNGEDLPFAKFGNASPTLIIRTL